MSCRLTSRSETEEAVVAEGPATVAEARSEPEARRDLEPADASRRRS